MARLVHVIPLLSRVSLAIRSRFHRFLLSSLTTKRGGA